MKRLFLLGFCFAFLNLTPVHLAHAQDPAAAVAAQAAAAATPQAATAAVPAPPVVVPAPAAPPQWATDLLMAASKLPVIGPLLSKAEVYLGILAAILTSIVACLLMILAALGGIFQSAGLTNLVTALTNFKNGPIMYWLTYFSNFNAPPKA